MTRLEGDVQRWIECEPPATCRRFCASLERRVGLRRRAEGQRWRTTTS